ncbi:flavin reductase [Streptomyces sp. NPDC057623]|uniref:flavin reductase n=1 Tax=Streptomyces sp. NPDC057623 TaxID=3346187 RepID=UPI003689EA40
MNDPAPPAPPVKLFCLADEGDPASLFPTPLTRLRPELIPVPVEPAGRDGRHRAPSRRMFEETVDAVVARIAHEADGGPYAVYGHGPGGLLGYEAAHRLVGDGHRQPEHLFLSADGPPQRRGDRAGGAPARIRHSGPSPRLTCPVTIVTRPEDTAVPYPDPDPWADLTTGPVTRLELADADRWGLAARIHDTLLGEPGAVPPGPLTVEAFRDAMACLAAPVTVVSTWDEQGRARAFTASAVCSLSAAPPLLLVCVSRSGRAHEVFRTSGRYLVNVLGHEQAAVARDFARPDRTEAEAALVPLELGLPGLANAAARFACTSHQVLPGGDHSILTGRLEAATLSDTPPLIHFRRDWHRPTAIPAVLPR